MDEANETEELILRIKNLAVDITDATYGSRIEQGYELLVKLRDRGLEKEQVYEQLILYHDGLAESLSRDYIAELLDYTVGWCSPQKKIWNLG